MDLAGMQKELCFLKRRINEMEISVEQMKLKPEEKKTAEYKIIDDLASLHPLTRDVLECAEESTQHLYIGILGNMALSENEYREARLLYIAKIMMGMSGQEKAVEQIIELGLRFEAEELNYLFSDLEQVKGSFLVDAFVVANICGKASEQMAAMLEPFTKALGCDREDIEVIATVAKSVMTDDFSDLDRLKNKISPNWNRRFPGALPERWLAGYRVYCGQYCVSTDLTQYGDKMVAVPRCHVKKQVEAGEMVKKEDELVSYIECKASGLLTSSIELPSFGLPHFLFNRKEKKAIGRAKEEAENVKSIFSLADGLVFYLENEIVNEDSGRMEKFVNVYVVSPLDDYEALYRWNKKN